MQYSFSVCTRMSHRISHIWTSNSITTKVILALLVETFLGVYDPKLYYCVHRDSATVLLTKIPSLLCSQTVRHYSVHKDSATALFKKDSATALFTKITPVLSSQNSATAMFTNISPLLCSKNTTPLLCSKRLRRRPVHKYSATALFTNTPPLLCSQQPATRHHTLSNTLTHKPKPHVYNPNDTFLQVAVKFFLENQRFSQVSIATCSDWTALSIQTVKRVAGQMRHLNFSGYYLYHCL